MRIIKPMLHALLDYITVAFLFLAPALITLSPLSANLCYILAGVQLILTVSTDYIGGLIKAVPYRIHGVADFLIGFLVVIIAVSMRETITDQTFFAALALTYFVVFLLTDFRYYKSVGPE